MTAEPGFESTDLGQIRAQVRALYPSLQIAAHGSPIRARLERRVVDAHAEFHDVHVGFDLGYDAAPARRLVFCDVVSHSVHRDGRGQGAGETFGPGEQFLLFGPGAASSGLVRSARMRLTVLDPAALAVAAGAADDTPLVEVVGHRPVSRKAQAKLQRAIAHVRDDVMADPAAVQAPLLAAAVVQYLAAVVLHTYPNTAVLDLPTRERRDASPPAVARAAAFMEANPDQVLTLADIAAAAHVSPRALQLGFRRHLDTTPMAYLRRIRMDHAHAELLAARDDGLTVATVAARWGFALSGFSEQYRSAHRELPSQTLRR